MSLENLLCLCQISVEKRTFFVVHAINEERNHNTEYIKASDSEETMIFDWEAMDEKYRSLLPKPPDYLYLVDLQTAGLLKNVLEHLFTKNKSTIEKFRKINFNTLVNISWQAIISENENIKSNEHIITV